MTEDEISQTPPPSTAEARCGGAAATGGGGGEEEDDAAVLQFLDSLDDYLTLLDSLSSTLRQGWIDLAGARHSMGSSRISSALFDLKVHSAPTTVQMSQSAEGSLLGPHFTLSKWTALREGMHYREVEDDVLQRKSDISQLRRRGPSETTDEVPNVKSTTDEPTVVSNGEVQMERSKSLLVFGALVSPKLRSAQVSFETAFDTIVELVNLRSLMLSAFSQIQRENKSQESLHNEPWNIPDVLWS